MSLPIVFQAPARIEFDEAADWYQRRRAGLGERFTAAVREVLDAIASAPEAYPAVFEDLREAISGGIRTASITAWSPGALWWWRSSIHHEILQSGNPEP